jgi:UDP-4-amino-4,6-dideoxy-N-acetyl-beta-L-altrosamine transaminase
MIPYGKQTIDKKDIRAVLSALKSDWLTQGPKILEFEKALARYCGAKYAIAVSNGTAALHLAYLVGGLKKGDEVITTPNTFVATTNMLLAVGVKPVFCDIRNDTLNIDEKQIENLITEKTKAIVPVHFAGNPCEMDKIMEIAKKRGLLVIEDGCHALGAKYKNKKIGSIGDMTIFSFHPVKSITTGEGGAVLTDNENFYRKLLSLRSHGIYKDENGFNVMKEMGYNYRLTDIQSALGISQLKKLENFIKKRQKVATLYKKQLEEVGQIILPEEKKENRSARHLYVIRVKNKNDRMPLYNFLKKNGVGANFHYPPVYSHPYYRENGFADTSLPNADLYGETAITLPIHTFLKEKDVKLISSLVKDYFINKNR